MTKATQLFDKYGENLITKSFENITCLLYSASNTNANSKYLCHPSSNAWRGIKIISFAAGVQMPSPIVISWER